MWAVVLPLLLIVVVLVADLMEGPKTAFVGVLAVVPMFAAVFGTPWSTAAVGAVTWVSAFVFGLFASDGNVPAQYVRLGIIAITSVIAVLASRVRIKREEHYVRAVRDAALAEQLRHQAHTDELTGLLNRRGGLERLTEHERDSATVALVDCDGLKQVNDRLGHQAGDEYLRAIAERMAAAVSADDLVARWGGDEFLLTLGLGKDRAAHVLERVRTVVSANPVATGATATIASISLGATEWHNGESLDDVLLRADAALYEAKETGRNKVVWN